MKKTNAPILPVLKVLCVVIPLFGNIAFAQTETPSAGFKRVKVGDAPSGDLINIQIEPDPITNEIPQPPALDTAATTERPKGDLQDWFWNRISPALNEADGNRLRLAVDVMADAPPYFQANLASMRKLAGLYGRDIVIGSLGTDVSPALILAMIAVESSGKVDALSSKGAQGLMQLIPDTAARFGVADPNDPLENIKGGAKYMSWLLNEFENDPLLALAGYNAGENAVKNAGGIPEYPETRAYVPKVIAAWQVAAGLCRTPPVYVWQGCAFTVPAIERETAKAEPSE